MRHASTLGHPNVESLKQTATKKQLKELRHDILSLLFDGLTCGET